MNVELLYAKNDGKGKIIDNQMKWTTMSFCLGKFFSLTSGLMITLWRENSKRLKERRYRVFTTVRACEFVAYITFSFSVRLRRALAKVDIANYRQVETCRCKYLFFIAKLKNLHRSVWSNVVQAARRA